MNLTPLERLRNLKPEDLEIENPSLVPYWEAHLIYLLENHPESTYHLFQTDKESLKKKLLRIVQRATIQEIILQREGELERDQIQEIVYSRIVAPIIDQPEPKQLPDRQYMKVLNWSQSLDED